MPRKRTSPLTITATLHRVGPGRYQTPDGAFQVFQTLPKGSQRRARWSAISVGELPVAQGYTRKEVAERLGLYLRDMKRGEIGEPKRYGFFATSTGGRDGT